MIKNNKIRLHHVVIHFSNNNGKTYNIYYHNFKTISVISLCIKKTWLGYSILYIKRLSDFTYPIQYSNRTFMKEDSIHKIYTWINTNRKYALNGKYFSNYL